MKHLFFILFFALTFTASGQTITTFNYIQKGKVYARTTTITVKGKVVHINKKKRRLRLNGKIYIVKTVYRKNESGIFEPYDIYEEV